MPDDFSGLLPTELLTKCLDNLREDDLLEAMLVSTRWNFIATAHPTYWRYISINDSSYRRPRLFKLRLERANERAIQVSIDVRSSTATNTMIGSILPAVAAHIHHIEHLYFRYVHVDTQHAVFAALGGKLAILDWLAICFTGGTAHFVYPAIPISTFQALADAPRLRYLGLNGVTIPPPPLPAILTVTTLNYDPPFVHRRSDSDAFLAALPNLTKYIAVEIVREEVLASLLAACSRVQIVQVSGASALHPSHLRLASLAHFPTVIVRWALPTVPKLFCSHLRGSLNLCISDAKHREEPLDLPTDPYFPGLSKDFFRVTFISPSNACTRVFYESPNNYLHNEGDVVDEDCDDDDDDDGYRHHHLFGDRALLERLTTVSFAACTHYIWNFIVPILTSLPSLSTLGIEVWDSEDLLLTKSPLDCPALTTISFTVSRDGTTIFVEHLRDFTRTAIVGASFPLTLTLGDNIMLKGDKAHLSGLYDESISVHHNLKQPMSHDLIQYDDTFHGA
ncbi:hypothetical protein EXIGLDRAFT_842668 [Exidia glandulosa HHB12029]|uniref:F-box domain-containing protein n=1 Tax=Exidia glandulosa HHB12029 TaxID=1314781 RepID=A0A165D568_EXIGL|nr:hypothetical protein EXIGLDRAFT_842668 [Exidia glandulosa HHB12029]